MRRLIQVLVALAAVCFLFGVLASLFGIGFPAVITLQLMPHFDPETYWRGTTALLLFAMTLLMMERRKER
jgi:uncharacterized membrane protein YfcA